jgi:hypothetical protein
VLTSFGAGAILKHTGTLDDPFSFVTVGRPNNEVAYMCEHQGRIFCTTWTPSTGSSGISGALSLLGVIDAPISGLWMSPLIPEGGLQRHHQFFWQEVWTPDEFDPDPVLAFGTGGGALASFGSWLYFGTISWPLGGTAAFIQGYGLPPELEGIDIFNLDPTTLTPQQLAALDEMFDNAQRNEPYLFRGRGFSLFTEPEIQLLYGPAELSKYDPEAPPGSQWSMEPTKYGGEGQYGEFVFDNEDTQYVWSAGVHDNKLYIGTFDISTASRVDEWLRDPAHDPEINNDSVGADIWCFPSPGVAPVPLDNYGAGNPSNHGIRNIESTPNGLFLGSSNIAGFLQNPPDGLPSGGWELIKVNP